MMAIFVATLMILSALVIALPGSQGREYGMNPAATASDNIQPNPTLNTNVTWSTFYNGWSPLEYNNGSTNLTLSANPSSIYANYTRVNPTDIQAAGALQKDNVGTQNKTWENATWTANVNTGDGTGSFSIASQHLSMKLNDSATTHNTYIVGLEIPISSLPSNNPSYDYITYAGALTGTSMTGVYGVLYLSNSSGQSQSKVIQTTPGNYAYSSCSLAQIAAANNYGITFNTSGKGTTSYVEVNLAINTPASSTPETYTYTLYGFALTTEPLTLGTTANGSLIHQTQNGLMQTFRPDFSWSSITDNGYTVAVSQPMQNVTTQQSAINTAGYIEQVEYQGQFNLPTAPDLSYGAANLTEHFNVSTSQTQVLDVNGVSYLSAISGKNNTIQLLSSVNPNGQTQFLQIVDYTQSQWTSISSPPGIFTLAGIEYYWEEFIIAVLAIVGVGAGAASRHASNLRKVK